MTRTGRAWPPMALCAAAGLILGIAAACLAPALGLVISGELGNRDGQVTWLNVLVGTFLCGMVFWRLIAGRTGLGSPLRGAMAGVFTGLVAYPLVIALAEFVQRDWSNAPPLLERIEQINLITMLTVITTGPLAMLLMGLVGTVIAILFGWLQPAAPSGTRGKAGPVAVRMAGVSVLVLAVAGLGATYAWFGTQGLRAPAFFQSTSGAEMSYQNALTAFDRIAEHEAASGVHEICRSTLMSHGGKAAGVVVYFHGFTSCPAQGDALAEQMFALGYNVYMPRMHGHGIAEPLVTDLDGFVADQLVEFAMEAVDLAQGLGDEVIVMGLSAGGTLSAWLAQFRDGIDHAILISPFFGPYLVPTQAMLAGTNFVQALPNIVLPWNPLENSTPEKAAIPHAIPSTHALIEIMLVGWQIHDAARHSPPATHRISVLLNDADVAVNNRQTLEIAQFWSAQGAAVEITRLPFSHRLPHDMINTRERGANTEIVYPALLALLGAGQR